MKISAKIRAAMTIFPTTFDVGSWALCHMIAAVMAYILAENTHGSIPHTLQESGRAYSLMCIIFLFITYFLSLTAYRIGGIRGRSSLLLAIVLVFPHSFLIFGLAFLFKQEPPQQIWVKYVFASLFGAAVFVGFLSRFHEFKEEV